ncbi:Kp4-domain-containing protein [Podospora appendiculata]|uniref:Kp4-domain-containing protein n=1 Tax=Podospora appendiculata TaxID=314037 RepID=A0AAE1C6Z3_9PEZI|nr:Kp4-domain-containing protein [Podospora appendiculata]
MKLSSIISFAAFSSALALPTSADQSENPATLVTRDLGINCRGSVLCNAPAYGDNAAKRLQAYINNGIQTSRVYRNGEHIACVSRDGTGLRTKGGFCAFLQGTTRNIDGGSIKLLIGYIVNHGCVVCGSVPIDYQNGSNNPANGILTINAVEDTANPCLNGIC